jgi:hypothetical protein
MTAHLSMLMVLLILPYLSTPPPNPLVDPHFSKNPLTLLVKNEEEVSPKEDSRQETSSAIEEYEQEKLAKIKKNIGRRLLTVKTVNPAVFYESPDDLERKLGVKREKEGLVIMEVVQNQLGNMNFYRVKFDTGQIGYLSADANYLEIKIKEGKLISVPKRGSAKKKSLSQSKTFASEAVERVKNHLALADPVTSEKRSVEKRMMDQKARSFPNLKWRYEAKEIGNNKYRVTQYAGEGVGPPSIRTWIVDLSTAEVKPENLAAKEMYR